MDKSVKAVEEHYTNYEKKMETIEIRNKEILGDLYGYDKKLEHSTIKNIRKECGEIQNNLIDLYDKMSPENMNSLLDEIEKYKVCLNKI